MRECDFKNFQTDFKNSIDRLLKLYNVTALTPRQKLKLSIILNSRIPEKRVKTDSLFSVYADTDSII